MSKHIKHIIILMVILIIPNTGIANHVLGGNVFYEHITAKKYKIKVRVFRDCNECSFGGVGGGGSLDTCSDLKVVSIYNKDNGSWISDVTVTRESFKDITPVCSGITSKCGTNPGVIFGIEEHWFSCIIDFSSYSNVCNFEISTKISSRSTSINANNEAQHYYNNAVLNLCKQTVNNSARINAIPLQIIYLNEAVRYNIEAYDVDGDSLSYKLVKAKISFDKFIDYSIGKSETLPLKVLCPNNPCVIDKTLTKPTGLYFSEKSGELVFTPDKLDESGVFVIEITEHREINGTMEIVGVVRSDVQFYVANPIGNNPPDLLNDVLEFKICAGDDFCIDFNATDKKYGSKYDTVSFSCFSEVKGFSFIENSSKNEPYNSSSFCWETTAIDARSSPYYFTIKLQDNGCPIKKASYHTFSVLVKENVSASAKIVNIGCGELQLTALTKAGSNYSSYWQIMDSSNIDLKFFYEKDTFWQSPKNGEYHLWYVNQNDDNGCNVGILDTIIVENISDLSLELGKDLVLCESDTYKVTPSVSGNIGGISYKWQDESTNVTFSGVVDTIISIQLLITDENLCTEEATKLISPFSKLNVTIEDKEICLTDERLNLSNLFKEKNQTLNYNFYSNGVENASIELFDNDWILSLNKFIAPKVYEIFLSYMDIHGCSFTDTFNVTVSNPPKTNYSNIRTLCSNEKTINLNRETNNKIEGNWSFPFNPSLLDNLGNLNIESFKKNENHIVYFSTAVKGCLVNENFSFSIIGVPSVSIIKPNLNKVCVSGDSIFCEGSIPGGLWSGNGLRKDYFVPFLASKELATISYFYLDPITGCSNSDSVKIEILKEPVFSFSKNLDTICELGKASVFYHAYNESTIDIASIPAISLSILSNEINLDHSRFPNINNLKLIGKANSEVCKADFDTFTLTINNYPKGNFVPDKLTGCEPLNVEFSLANSNYSIDDLIINLNGEGVLFNSLKVSGLVAGEYDYSLFASYEGCKDTFQFKGLKVNAAPIAKFVVNPSLIYADDPVAYYTNFSSCKDSFKSYWNFNGKQDSNYYHGDVVIQYLKVPSIYETSLTARTLFGCEDYYSESIEIQPSRDLHIPTAFTPNGKGPRINEKFQVISSVTGDFKIIILNRWGEQIFISKNISDSWDGTYNGKPCKPGAYAYKIRVDRNDGYRKEYNGTVILLRAGE